MTQQKTLKIIHFASTIWFMLCTGYILALALRLAGKSWWFIASLSGYSTLLAFLLISLYLFAVYRGVARSQKSQVEHPLTTSVYYLIFYDVSPFLGAVAGCLGAIGVTNLTHALLLTAGGALWGTFLVWIIIDPATGLIEMMLPASRKHRQNRLRRAAVARQREKQARRRLFEQIEARDQEEKTYWNKILQPYADNLARLVDNKNALHRNTEARVVDIGLSAWQMGGLNCMRQLHEMALENCNNRHRNEPISDYISIWWDGVGTWRDPALG